MESKTNPKQKVAFITGASSGIGAGVAKELAKRGFAVALVARRAERLKQLQSEIEAAGGQALALSGDVTYPESLREAVSATRERFSKLDLVLANAGFAVTGSLKSLTADDYRRQFETNVFGVLNTIYATQDSLIETRGILGIVGSVAGHIPLPHATPYSMSKFAVRALAGGLRVELRRKGVAVVLISPGFIETEIGMIGNDGRPKEQDAHKMPNQLKVPLAKAAPQITRGLLSRRAEVMITNHAKVAAQANRFFPGLVRWASGKMMG